MKYLLSTYVVIIALSGCGKSKLDTLVGDYNAQLAAVREASISTDKNLAADESASAWQWRDPKFKEASDKAVESVHRNLNLALDKALQLRKELEADSGFVENYRYNQYLEGDRWARFVLDSKGEQPFRFAEKK